jgi:hypothetical protein
VTLRGGALSPSAGISHFRRHALGPETSPHSKDTSMSSTSLIPRSAVVVGNMKSRLAASRHAVALYTMWVWLVQMPRPDLSKACARYLHQNLLKHGASSIVVSVSHSRHWLQRQGKFSRSLCTSCPGFTLSHEAGKWGQRVMCSRERSKAATSGIRVRAEVPRYSCPIVLFDLDCAF